MKKKLFSLIFLFLFILSVTNNVGAQWEKKETPVLDISSGRWDSLHVSSPGILCEEGICKMWYGGEAQPNKTSIGYATSTDGINWIKYQNNPVLQPSVIDGITEQGVGEPAVIHNDKYRLWYTSIAPGESYRIGYAVSDDGVNWSKNAKFALNKGSGWDGRGVSHPYVIFENGIYHMWYTGWGLTNSWMLGYATSTDGVNWTRSSSNPLSIPTLGHIGAPSVIKMDSLYHLYYHTGGSIPTNIYRAVSEDKINWSCQDSYLVLNRGGNFDSQMIARSEVFQAFGRLNLLFGGFDGAHWRIGLATNTPIVETKNPIIIIPGFLGSWNKEAILHNQTINYDQWTVPQFVKEYDAVKQTLINLGYRENKDFYVFAYDWRNSVETSVDNLNHFIQSKNIDGKFNLVGHSLGGIIARIYGQKYGIDGVNKIITVGSPHQGTALIYKAVEAGEISQNDSLMWLALKIILTLNKEKFETDKETINSSFPVLKDLFPTYNFLKNLQNQEININSLSVKNNLLMNYQSDFPRIFPVFQSITGEKGNTLSGYQIKQRSTLEQILDLYPDGRPTGSYFEDGDLTVISRSARAGYSPVTINLEHGELIYKTDGLIKILENLDISYGNSQLVQGRATKLTPSLVFLILSPAEIEVTHNENTYRETDGVIFIENYQAGDYVIKAKGKEAGQYTIVIGQLNETNDNWLTIKGEINGISPTTQTDIYQLNFNPQLSQIPHIPPNNLFSELKIIISGFYSQTGDEHFQKSLYYLNTARALYQKNDIKKTKVNLLNVHQQMFLGYKEINSGIKNEIIGSISKLESLYTQTTAGLKNPQPPKVFRKKLDIYQRQITSIENKTVFLRKVGIKFNLNKKVLIETENRIKLAEEAIKSNNLNYAEILLESIKELLKNIYR